MHAPGLARQQSPLFPGLASPFKNGHVTRAKATTVCPGVWGTSIEKRESSFHLAYSEEAILPTHGKTMCEHKALGEENCGKMTADVV